MPINISFIYKLIIIFILKSRKIKCPRIGFCLRKLQNIRPTKIDDYTVHVYGGFKALTKYGSFEYIFINEFFSCKMYMSRSIFISDPLEMLQLLYDQNKNTFCKNLNLSLTFNQRLRVFNGCMQYCFHKLCVWQQNNVMDNIYNSIQYQQLNQP